MSDTLEAELLEANRKAMDSGCITPLLKKELWLKIQSRRLSEGKEELVVPPTPSLSYKVSQAERAKKLRRQEQNRRAAKRFRKKERGRVKILLEKIDDMEDSTKQLEEERMSLIREKNETLLHLCQHLQHCQTCPAPSLQHHHHHHHQHSHADSSASAIPTLDDKLQQNESDTSTEDGQLQYAESGIPTEGDAPREKSHANSSERLAAEGPTVSESSLGLKNTHADDISATQHDNGNTNVGDICNAKEQGLCSEQEIDIVHIPGCATSAGQPDDCELENEDNVSGTQSMADVAASSQHSDTRPVAIPSQKLLQKCQGFGQGVMFLQIIDGKVFLQNMCEPVSSLGVDRHTASVSADDAPVTVDEKDSKPGTSENKLLYRLHTSDGLPFFIMDNCLHKSEPATESLTSPGTSNQAEELDQPPKAKKQKRSPKIVQRRSTKANNIKNRTKPLAKKPEATQTKFTVYQDPAESDGLADPKTITSALKTNAAKSRSKQIRGSSTSLRDETNVIRNQTELGSSSTHKESTHIRRPLRKTPTSTSTSFPECAKTPQSCDFVSTNAETSDLDIQRTFQGSSSFSPGKKQTSFSQTDATGQSASRPASSSAKYDPEFKSFLSGCFDSLDQDKAPEEKAVSTQGLVLLTSMELRFLASGDHGQANVLHNDASKLDLPSLDSVCLMNLLKDGVSHAHKDETGIADSSSKASFPVILFSGLKSLLLDSENNLLSTTGGDNPPPPPLPPSLPSSHQGYYVLPIIQNSGSLTANLVPSTDTTSATSHAHVSPTVFTGAMGTTSGQFSSVLGDGLPAGQALGSVSNTALEYNRLVKKLIQGLASGQMNNYI
ncbi:uncharacterized protein [Littorina saxatilis]|uniref:uncharacterized protein n=1 Tax=Littorina saxatilis TaxID=31220 RepID=UPI0038B60F29